LVVELQEARANDQNVKKPCDRCRDVGQEYFGTEKAAVVGVPQIRTMLAAIDECNLGTPAGTCCTVVVVFRFC
jgi:hypothetical protein